MTLDDATHLRHRLERFEAHAWRVTPEVRNRVRDLFVRKLETLTPEPLPELELAEPEPGPMVVRPALRLQEGTGEEQVLPLDGELRIGRSHSCHLTITGDSKLSRVHARLLARDDGWLVEDLHSANGTLINGEMLAPGASRRLYGDEELILGETFLRFHWIPVT